MKQAFFTISYHDKHTQARTGILNTPHGVIHTPAFVPVGTQATVKSLTPEELVDLGIELFFINTYHLYLRPGLNVIKRFGDVHAFMGWNRPLISDSGGFQVFSLGGKQYVNIAISEAAVLDRDRFTKKLSRVDSTKNNVYPDEYKPVGRLVDIDEDGVTFTSHWDGTKHRFTPEVSIDIQHQLGADLIIAFDECPPYPTTYEYAKEANRRTHAWGLRSLAQHAKDNKKNQALYGVIQGSIYEDLRKDSARVISGLPFEGIAIGGVAVGEPKETVRQVCDWVIPLLPPDKPRHLLGVGEIDDIFDIVERGIDTFDCVMPTRLGRMGHILCEKWKTKNRKWTFDITKKLFSQDTGPLTADCGCYTCKHFSRAYVHHLFRVKELLGYRLATIHNLFFLQNLVAHIRNAITTDSLVEMKKHWLYNTI